MAQKKNKFNNRQALLKIEKAKVARFAKQLFDVHSRLNLMVACVGLSDGYRFILNSLIIQGSLLLERLIAMMSNAMIQTFDTIWMEEEMLESLQQHISSLESLKELGLSVETH